MDFGECFREIVPGNTAQVGFLGALLRFDITMGKGLLDYLKDPMKELSEGRMNSFVKIADAVKTFEPELAPILQNAINRFRG